MRICGNSTVIDGEKVTCMAEQGHEMPHTNLFVEWGNG